MHHQSGTKEGGGEMRVRASLMIGVSVMLCLLVCAAAFGEKGDELFPGKWTEYSDAANGFKMKLPAELKLKEKGAVADWIGPIMDGAAVSVYVNTVVMKGAPSKILYDTNFSGKRGDPNYTEVTQVKLSPGKRGVYAFRAKEVSNRPGSSESKEPGDIHRWHLWVFGNDRMYTLGFTGAFASFQANRLQRAFERIISSFELLPAKQGR